MALTPAEKQQRYRDKLKARAQAHPDHLEAVLLREVEQADEFSDQERVVLADKLTDIAMRHLWRSHELSRIATKVRTGGR
jgi:hypothetical protein